MALCQKTSKERVTIVMFKIYYKTVTFKTVPVHYSDWSTVFSIMLLGHYKSLYALQVTVCITVLICVGYIKFPLLV